MEILKETEQQPEPIPQEQKLTREQRRMRDRINEEAKKTFYQLAERFRVCFMDNRPESEEVAAKRKEVNAKWRMYCKGNNLIPEAYNQVSEFCDSLIEQYKSELNDTTQTRSEPGN